MRIGITERGDAGLDTTWYDRLDIVDAAIIITKNATLEEFQRKIIAAHNNGRKLILHATCTGMGGTALEPNAPEYHRQIDGVRAIIDAGFPVSQIVLRIDPIFPDRAHVATAKEVAEYAVATLPGLSRIRISIMDLHYRHLQNRFREAGLSGMLPHTFKSESYIDPDIVTAVTDAFAPFAERGISIETCAEPILCRNSMFESNGCVSNKDMEILGLPAVTTNNIGMQRPGACKCLPKTELLTRRAQCPHRCLYCFWR